MDYTPLTKWDAHPSMIYPEIGDNNMRRLCGVVVAANWKTQQLSAVCCRSDSTDHRYNVRHPSDVCWFISPSN